MGRLYRPSIPLEVKCRVALRQLEEPNPNAVIRMNRFVPRETLRRRSLGRLLDELLERVAQKSGCKVEDLRLDHDPPLAARMKRTVGYPQRHVYSPDANDPEHLFYRPHGPEHAGSHLIKTNVRGDHGQHPDRVLIKKARRAERGPKPKDSRRKSRIPKGQSGFRFSTNKSAPKRKWAKRPLRSRNSFKERR